MSFIPASEEQREKMLSSIGKSLEELFEAIPEDLQLKRELDLPEPISEMEVSEEVRKRAKLNEEFIHFAGGGVYDHYIPSAIKRITGRPEFYTAYTPYQAEVSQGTLQSMYEYQSMICELTDMEVSNASIYDGATSLAEAVWMALSLKRRRNKILLSEGINPRYLEVIKTYLSKEQEVEFIPLKDGVTDIESMVVDDEVCCSVIQSPNYLGNIEDVSLMVEKVQEVGGIAIQSFDPTSLALLKTPGQYGVDIATAEGQPLGIPMNLGGPHLGIFTTKKKYIRKMPGRLSGKTEDSSGNEGFVMALQTREQHIRRARATSNICTNQQLVALMAAIYLAAMGREGLKNVANQTTQKAHYLKDKLEKAGFPIPFSRQKFFREFVVEIPYGVQKAMDLCTEKGIIPGINLGKWKKEWDNLLLISLTEKRTKKEMDELVDVLSSELLL